MKKYLINAFGRDRPGLVAAITRCLYENQANLGDLQMTRLGGVFALLLEFYLPPENEAGVSSALEAVGEHQSLEINLVPAAPYQSDRGKEKPNHIITLYGADKPGIVYELTRTLGQLDVNIVNLETRLAEEEELYLMVLEVHRPDELSPEKMTEQLKKTAGQIDTHLEIRPFDPPEL